MRYFKLANKNAALLNLIGNIPKFTFHRNALTCDINDIRERINTELELRNFEVPGIDIEFCHSVNEEGIHYIYIYKIRYAGQDVTLTSDWLVRIGRMELSLHSDNSGSLEVYCGNNWGKDRDEFIKGVRHHRKMNNKSRIVLQYDFGQNFKATDDCGRGHFPDGSDNEPLTYSMFAVETEIIFELTQLLNYIMMFPVPDKDVNVFAEPKPTKLDNPIFEGAELHLTLDDRTVRTIKGQTRKNYGKDGDWRLLSCSIAPPVDHKYSNIMNDGFTYCEIGFPGVDVPSNIWHNRSGEDYSAIVDLDNADCVFVVDRAAGDRFKENWFKTNPDESTMDNPAYEQMCIERANTMIHINDYVGGFDRPVVIINRILRDSEIRIISKIKKRSYDI